MIDGHRRVRAASVKLTDCPSIDRWQWNPVQLCAEKLRTKPSRTEQGTCQSDRSRERRVHARYGVVKAGAGVGRRGFLLSLRLPHSCGEHGDVVTLRRAGCEVGETLSKLLHERFRRDVGFHLEQLAQAFDSE